MTEDILGNKVYKIIREVFSSNFDDIQDDWGPNEIPEWDSMNHLNLVMVLNDSFHIDLEFDEVLSIETVGDIFKILEKKGIKFNK